MHDRSSETAHVDACYDSNNACLFPCQRSPLLYRLVEGSRPLRSKDLLVLRRRAVGQRELEVLGEKLADVRAADVVGLLDLDDLEDL